MSLTWTVAHPHSLGVLQSNSVEFVPRFPDWKREALQSFHMATYTKIFLRFKEKFWADWQVAVYIQFGNAGVHDLLSDTNRNGFLQSTCMTVRLVCKQWHTAEWLLYCVAESECTRLREYPWKQRRQHLDGDCHL